MNRQLRFVIDTSVLVSAFRSDAGYSFDFVSSIDQGIFLAVVTPALYLEYEQVLKRPEHSAVHGLSHTDIDQLLQDMLFHVHRVRVTQRVHGEAADPNDDFVLEAAVNGFADAIVTYNTRHLLSPAARRGIRVITPAAIFMQGLLP